MFSCLSDILDDNKTNNVAIAYDNFQDYSTPNLGPIFKSELIESQVTGINVDKTEFLA